MPSQLSRISSSVHLIIVLILISFCFSPSNSLFSTSPFLILHSLPEDSYSPATSPADDDVNVSPMNNFSFRPNPIAKIPLQKVADIKNFKSVLTVSSVNANATESFVIEIHNPVKPKRQFHGESIIYSFFGVTVTNLCSISGFVCIPVKRWRYFNHLLNYMMALAVSALFSTAALVLLPEAMRMIDMPLEFGGQGRTYLYKLVCIPAGALFFYFVEYILMILPRLLRRKASSESGNGSEGVNATEWYEQLNGTKNTSNPEISGEAGADSDTGTRISAIKGSTKRGRVGRCCVCFSPEKFSKIATVAWMILFGDAFHNFMDGMTIAVGFTESPSVGIALSLSILFEELPHELGDFAVLISSGFSIKSALVANFLSSCSAYLGMILGLIIGEVSSSALYVFVVTAGFFFYISLSNMLPSLRGELEEKEKKNENSFWLFLIQLAGLLTGFGCVLSVNLVSDLISF